MQAFVSSGEKVAHKRPTVANEGHDYRFQKWHILSFIAFCKRDPTGWVSKSVWVKLVVWKIVNLWQPQCSLYPSYGNTDHHGCQGYIHIKKSTITMKITFFYAGFIYLHSKPILAVVMPNDDSLRVYALNLHWIHTPAEMKLTLLLFKGILRM